MKLSISRLLVARDIRRRSTLSDQGRDLGERCLRGQNGNVPQVTNRAVIAGLGFVLEVDGTRDDQGEREEDAHRGESTPESRDHVVPRN
jgi:hypothetical protein